MIIADQSQDKVFNEKCLKLSELHNIAVDYPKRGKPVDHKEIPKLHFESLPDWSAPETIKRKARYYVSKRALGWLFRDIELPVARDAFAHGKQSRKQVFKAKMVEYAELLSNLTVSLGEEQDLLSHVLHSSFPTPVTTDCDDVKPSLQYVLQLFKTYRDELIHICQTYILSSRRSEMLTEEEVVVGTIIAKASLPRKRTDLIVSMRDRTTILANQINDELSGDKEVSNEKWLLQAWIAWRVSVLNANKNVFGSKSFGLIALDSIFEVLRLMKHPS